MSEFKIKTAEELEGMTAEELAGYYNEYNDFQRKEIEAKIEAKASDSEVKELRTKLDNVIEQQVKTLNEALKEQGLKIKKLTDAEKTEKALTTFGTVHKALTENKEILQKIKDGARESIKFSVKAVGNMTITTNVTGEIPQGQREAGLNIIATRVPLMQGLIQRGVATSNLIQWVEQTGKEGGAGGTAEGIAKNQADFDLVLASEEVVKRTVYIKASEEMLEDIDFMTSEINNELLRLLSLDIDNQILNGDGVAPNLNGIMTQATAFAAGTFANTINNANNWDVLKVAINQVMIAHFEPNVIIMHPSDVTAMQLSKDGQDAYLLPPFTSAEGLTVSGIRIVPTTVMTAGDYLVMDGTRASTFWKKDVTIEVGWENDDFTKNFRTILAEARLALRIKGNDTGAFVYGDFTTDKAALETP